MNNPLDAISNAIPEPAKPTMSINLQYLASLMATPIAAEKILKDVLFAMKRADTEWNLPGNPSIVDYATRITLDLEENYDPRHRR